jgi:tetratricopeptide (TPR) repeat protein
MKVDEVSPAASAPTGNTALKALRLSRHWTQAEFATEFEMVSRALGKVLSLSVRQVRRWESIDPPCPLPAYQRVLEEVFGVSVAQMGFQVGWTVPWAPRPEPERVQTGRALPTDGVGAGGAGGEGEHGRMAGLCRVAQPADRSGGLDPVRRRDFVTSAVALSVAAGTADAAYGASGDAGGRLAAASDPASKAVPFDRGMVDGYEFITGQQRSLYWMVPPARMYQPAVAHAQLGAALLAGSGPQVQRARLAAALAQASLLAARLAYFDLKKPDQARLHYRNALIAAREADDHQLGSAILAHMAFIPAYDGQAGEARDLMRAAYAHAARGVSVSQRSWLHAVDGEVEAKLGDGKRSIELISRAEDAFEGPEAVPDPNWLDYYDRTRLNAFKGFCHLTGGSPEAAREALQCSLMALKPAEAKQRTIVLADLADICVKTKEIDEACATLGRALENLDAHWYAMGWDRILGVRRNLEPHHDTRMVRELDVRLHSSWPGTMRLTGP